MTAHRTCIAIAALTIPVLLGLAGPAAASAHDVTPSAARIDATSDAQPDQARVMPETYTSIDALANDSYFGDAEVEVVRRSLPTGVRARVRHDGHIVVWSPRRFYKDSYSFYYRLRDSTGVESTAKVTVRVSVWIVVR